MAEEGAQTEAAQEAASPPDEKAGKGKFFMIVGASVLLLAVAGGASWYLGLLPFGKKVEAKEEVEEVKEPKAPLGALLPLDPFIANLNDDSGKRYLKATMQIEFFDSKVPDDFNGRLPQMRDLLLTLFSSKTFAEVRTPEGKAVLREEIINRVNRVLRKDLVKAVYFTDFIVQ
jgi:flagellar FliL protein